MKVAFLIPSKSRETWDKDPLIIKTIHSIGTTICPEHAYKIFIGFDADDSYYNNSIYVAEVKKSTELYNIGLETVKLDIEKGWLTKMWNKLADLAYAEGFDYLYMLGDDIQFLNKGWVNESIETLKSTNNIGMTGPTEINNMRILTQCFVHKTHYEIFKYLLPEEIKNWYCDDWMNLIYDVKRIKHTCRNSGGAERYTINRNSSNLKYLVVRDKVKIYKFKMLKN